MQGATTTQGAGEFFDSKAIAMECLISRCYVAHLGLSSCIPSLFVHESTPRERKSVSQVVVESNTSVVQESTVYSSQLSYHFYFIKPSENAELYRKIMQIVKCLSFFEIEMTVPEKSTMNLGELKIMDF